ncbi:MAG: DNA polymerase IV [Calditrichales bacterium]|nr:MAG: DNA polymerase IV [Calditrichales bacterium]
MQRFILHADMDAFFAAIEQREHPEFKGHPVIVGADPRQGAGRGVVSTCSYEARRYGIHSAMPISQAYKRCPHGIYVPPNGGLYSQVSKDIFKLFYQFSDLVEPLSIDEAFLDISGCIQLFGSAEAIGRQLKDLIYTNQGITASVGIAPNKYIAKIASDLEKPDGLVIVKEADIQSFLNPLPIARLWGAGVKTIEKLKQLGIHTIGDLGKFPLQLLEQKFGKMGNHFYRLAHGMDDRPVVSGHEVKSVSNEMTFSEDVFDIDVIKKTLVRLAEKVGYRMRQKDLLGRTVHLKLRYEGFETVTRNKTLADATANTEIIFQVVNELFEKNYDASRRVRLLGVGVSGFGKDCGHQLSLFDTDTPGQSNLDVVEDLVRKKFGKNAISRAEGLQKSANPDGWIE